MPDLCHRKRTRHRQLTCAEEKNREIEIQIQGQSLSLKETQEDRSRVRVRVRGRPAQPEPGAGDDEGHPEERPIRNDGERRRRDGREHGHELT